MKGFTIFPNMNAASLCVALFIMVRPIYAQTRTSCTSTMLQSFGPCMNYIANGSGTSPTADCCDSLKSLMTNGRDCACLILTGGIALRIPVNRTLAASLPKACKTKGVPIECKAIHGAPIPAPGPTIFGPPPPGPPPSLPPDANAPSGGDGTPSPSGFDGFPAMTPPGIRPFLSKAQPSQRVSHLILLALFGAVGFSYS